LRKATTITFITSYLVVLSICSSVCLSFYPSVFLSVCLSIRPSVRLSVRQSLCLSVCPSVRPSVCPSVRPFLRPHVTTGLSLDEFSCNFIFECFLRSVEKHNFIKNLSCYIVKCNMILTLPVWKLRIAVTRHGTQMAYFLHVFINYCVSHRYTFRKNSLPEEHLQSLLSSKYHKTVNPEDGVTDDLLLST
jgi:hypothetical protein